MPGTRHRTSPTTRRTRSATRRTRRRTPRTTPAPPPPDGLLTLFPTDERSRVAACVRARETVLVERAPRPRAAPVTNATRPGKSNWGKSLMYVSLAFTTAFVVIAGTAYGQFQTKLQPKTTEEFSVYAKKVEQQLQLRWEGRQPFLALDETPPDRAKVLHGELLIRPGSKANPVSISRGLVHDWLGDVFIPNVTMSKVLAIMQNFDRHREIYPEIIQSKLLRRNGDDLTGYWRSLRDSPACAGCARRNTGCALPANWAGQVDLSSLCERYFRSRFSGNKARKEVSSRRRRWLPVAPLRLLEPGGDRRRRPG